MQLESLPEGFMVNSDNDNGASSKAEALKQVDWLRASIESGEVVGFLACGIDNKGDAFGLGVVNDGVSLQDMHASLVKLHEVFHSGADEVAERLLAGEGGDDANPATSH